MCPYQLHCNLASTLCEKYVHFSISNYTMEDYKGMYLKCILINYTILFVINMQFGFLFYLLYICDMQFMHKNIMM